MMTRIVVIALLVLSPITWSQNTTRFSQFNVAKGLLNPAAVGTEAQYSAELIYRYQWMGVKGAPTTFGFIGGWEINPSMAVGITVLNDEVGIAQNNTFAASYAYRVIFNDDQYLALGVNAGTENVVSRFDQVSTIDPNDPAFHRGYNRWLFNAGFGLYYNDDRFYLGASIPELVQNTFRGSEKGFNMARFHYYLTGGFYAGKGNYVLNPLIQIKYTNDAPIQGDLLLRNIINGTFAFTVGYRSENAAVVGFDFMVANKVRFGYSFNYNVGKLRTQTGMAHELYLACGLPFYYNTNKFSKPRYFNKKGNYRMDVKKKYRKRLR